MVALRQTGSDGLVGTAAGTGGGGGGGGGAVIIVTENMNVSYGGDYTTAITGRRILVADGGAGGPSTVGAFGGAGGSPGIIWLWNSKLGSFINVRAGGTANAGHYGANGV